MLGLKIFLGVMIALMLLGIIGARTKCSKSIAGAITICCIVLLTAIVAKENQPKVTEVAPESGKIQTEQNAWGTITVTDDTGVTREYQGCIPFKYIHVMEIGKKGALHHHLVINTPEEISQQAIVRCWKGRGRTHHNPLDDTGQYAKLASYLIKQSDGMLRSPDALQGKRWNSSRNLRKPKVLRKEPVKDKGWYNRIARLPKKLEQSYYLDGNSVQEGIHEKTGYTFFTYTFVKINQTWKETELEWDKL